MTRENRHPFQFGGRVWRYGDNVNTDLIFPGKYTYTVTEPAAMARHALEDLDPDFAAAVQPGDVIVAGRNFGCGSSREQAVKCLTALGVGAVLAVSFARIFYRNALNNGLPVLACPEIVPHLEHGDPVRLNLTGGTLGAPHRDLYLPPLANRARELIAAGGLIPMLKEQLHRETQLRGVS